jgi:hypothetical protein
MLGEPLRAQKNTLRTFGAACFFCGSRRAIRSITFAPARAPEVRSAVASVVPLLSLSRKAEPFLSQNALAQAHLLQAVEIKFRSLYKLK